MTGRSRGRPLARKKDTSAPGSADDKRPLPSVSSTPDSARPGAEVGASVTNRPVTAAPPTGISRAWGASAGAAPCIASVEPKSTSRGRAQALQRTNKQSSTIAQDAGSSGPTIPRATGSTGTASGAGQSNIADGGGRGASRGDSKPAEKPAGAAGPVSMPRGDLAKSIDDIDGSSEKEYEKWYRRYKNPHTKPSHIADKKGASGSDVTVLSNFYKLQYESDYSLYQYHVDFDPPIDSRKLRRGLFHDHGERLLGVYTFDGMVAFSPTKLSIKKTEVISVRRHDEAIIRVFINLVHVVPKYHATLLHVFNLLMRQMLSTMGMEEVDRNFFSKDAAIRLPKHNLEIWPGYNTSILQYENDILLNIDIRHKVMRLNTAHDVMRILYDNASSTKAFHAAVHNTIVGKTILTTYNEKQYRIHDVNWDLTACSKFERRGRNGVTMVSYHDYFKETYDQVINHPKQPLLVHRVVKGDGERLIHLLPELCKMTGITDEMRTNFALMKDMGEQTRLNPKRRTEEMRKFRAKFDTAPRRPLDDFNLKVAKDLLQIPARILNPENIQCGPNRNKTVPAGLQADWTNALKVSQVVCRPVNNWYIIFLRNHQRNAENLRNMIFEVSVGMGVKFDSPHMISVDDSRATSFVQAMRSLKEFKDRFVLVLMPSSKDDFYSAIKKEAYVTEPHINQCVTNHRAGKPGGLRSVVTKIVVQINCKLGGEAWRLKMPIGGTMITGMDTYHDSAKRNQSVAGFVATLTSYATRYYSCTNHQTSHQELITQMQQKIIAALKTWYSINGSLPKRVIAYRDGVGDGQLEVVRDMEVQQYLDAFNTISRGEVGMWDPATQGPYTPEFAFIVVTKRINPRFFAFNPRNKQVDNPMPGTVVDQVATRPESYDFYLISQSVRQGTVSPAHYNIIKDSTGYTPDIMQQLTYKLCHLYYNWPGTIRVPAPCQYAHKLAYVTGTALHQTHSPQLNQHLFYL